MPSLNLILTTIGRGTLSRMLNSIIGQLYPQDYLTIISDYNHENISKLLSEYNFACKVNHIANPKPLGYWGHGSRTKYQNDLPGDYLMHGDDDDIYLPGAFDHIRNTIPLYNGSLLLYRWEINGYARWFEQGRIFSDNLGTPNGIFPNTHNIPEWSLHIGGFFTPYEIIYQKKLMPIVWIDKIIYHVFEGRTIKKPFPY